MVSLKSRLVYFKILNFNYGINEEALYKIG